MQTIEVGKPYPGIVPPCDGAVLQIGLDGSLVLMIQFTHPNEAELKALQAGIEGYSYYEAEGLVTIAAWVFKFPVPGGYFDAPFHGGFYKDFRIPRFLASEGDLLRIYIIDGLTVNAIHEVRLDHEAVAAFKRSLSKQLTERVSDEQYREAVDHLYQFETEQIFQMGTVFRHEAING